MLVSELMDKLDEFILVNGDCECVLCTGEDNLLREICELGVGDSDGDGKVVVVFGE